MKMVDPFDLEVHPFVKTMPKMKKHIYKELRRDISTFGVKVPLLVLKGTNMVIDGRYRLKAAQDVMIETVPVVEVENDRESIEFFILSLEKYRKPFDKKILTRGVER